jgi:DNA-binding winged helix-turn-helix (wHTH) protein/predicted ATPase
LTTIAPDKRIVFEPFCLDTVNECLWLGSKAIKVRPKAFAVLHYLIGRPGQLVTKEELLNSVWSDTFVSDAVLKVTIRQLREALDDDPKTPRYIETAHRRGYRFIGQLSQSDQERIPQPAQIRQESSTSATAAKSFAAVVGRDEVLSRMQSRLHRMLRGERQVVFVTGEAGIGKTSLVDAFAETIPADGKIRVGRGQCLDQYGKSEAYLPVLEAIGRLYRDEERLGHLLRAHAPMWLLQMPSLMTTAERELLSKEMAGATPARMLREMGEALNALTAELPVVLIIEDLHWSDYSTLDLISFLATQRERAHLMLIGTFRNVELILSRHPLKAVKQELLAKQQCEELALEYLTADAVSKYLSVRFPGNRFPMGLAGLIHERTDGNPLFMVNAVDYVVGEGLIAEREGLWELVVDSENVEVGVPDNIKQMIEKQVDQLGDENQQTLEAASVAGVEFSALALAAALEEDLDVVQSRCDELAGRRQYIQDCGIQELPNGEVVPRYGFIHALYQNVLYERMPPSRRAQLHRRIGERGEEVYGERAPEIASELAMHFERGRDYKRTAKYIQQSADTAIRRFAYREAVALARRGIDLIGKLPDSERCKKTELCLQLTLGVPLIAIEGYASPNVGKVYLRARELYQQCGDSPDVSEVLWGLWTYYTLCAELRTAREIAEEFLGLSARLTYPGLAMRAHLVMHVTMMHQGEFGPALEHYDKAAPLYDPERHREDAVFFTQNAGVALRCFGAWTLWFLGFSDQALERMHESLALARDFYEPHGLAHRLLFASILHQLRQEPGESQEYAEAVLTISREHELVMYEAQATIILGWALTEQGSVEEGIEEMRQGVANYQKTATALMRAQFLGLLGEVLGKAGQFEEALRHVDEALQLAHRSGDASYLPELHRVRGELLLMQAKGNLNPRIVADAEECFRRSIKIAQRQNAKSWELRTTVSLARLFQSQKKNQEARDVLEPVFDWFTEGFGTKDLREAEALRLDLRSQI